MPSPGRELDDLIGSVIVDCYGDDEELGAFLQAFAQELVLPAKASVIGVPVEVVTIEQRDIRRGLVARCCREGKVHEVALADVSLPPETSASRLHDAYRRWLGCEPMASRSR